MPDAKDVAGFSQFSELSAALLFIRKNRTKNFVFIKQFTIPMQFQLSCFSKKSKFCLTRGKQINLKQ